MLRCGKFLLALAIMIAVPGVAAAQATDGKPAEPEQTLLKPQQLDALVAPIALYPDELLANVLAASTYPLEAVQADRWVKAKKNLKGDALKAAVEKQAWDDSVKALASTSDVLAMMSDKIDWTKNLGDAVLAQQADVMDAIQRLCAKAHARNKLVTNSRATRDIRKVLGRDAQDIMFSGNEVADREARERFIGAYDAKHNVTIEGDKAFLVVGADDFPLPIPLTRQKAGWKFDTAAGRLEILYRRIGRNELDAIQTCRAYVDAQNEYAEKDRTGVGPGVYAQRIVSSSGKKDGLYWPASDGDASPLGEFVAQASAEGYKAGEGRTPYHGYYYRILTQQGPNAPGGTLSYVVKGKMIGGHALLAYPAEYGNSGVMTFLVNHSGTVYQKDLDDYTMRLVSRMMWFDPDQT
ncbi:DUF2950 family protein [Bradyrhizobium sp. TZ2]